jgi:hypothetical protein
MKEKRQTQRIAPFVAPCRYVSGEARVPAFLTDLSSRGARIHTDVAPPEPGAMIVVEVRLGGQAAHIRIPANVRWVQPSNRRGHVFGLSFEGIGSEEQKVVDSVVEEFRRRAAQIA